MTYVEISTLDPRDATRILCVPGPGDRTASGRIFRADGRVHSVQIVDLPRQPQIDLARLEQAYFSWIPRTTGRLVTPHWESEDGIHGPVRLAPSPSGWPTLMRLGAPRTAGVRRVREIEGGFLARPGGTFSIELTPSPGLGERRSRGMRLAVAVRSYSPRLPRFFYLMLQRPLHERISFGFLREVLRHTIRPGA